MKTKTIPCPDCTRKVRPCNLARHRITHMPITYYTKYGVEYKPAKEPLPLGKPKNDRRYDEIAPRGIGPTRYRLYRLIAGDLELLAAVATAQKIGEALVEHHAKGSFAGDVSVGILDTATEPGKWVSNPWTLGRRSE